jgi:hypothetical protein
MVLVVVLVFKLTIKDVPLETNEIMTKRTEPVGAVRFSSPVSHENLSREIIERCLVQSTVIYLCPSMGHATDVDRFQFDFYFHKHNSTLDNIHLTCSKTNIADDGHRLSSDGVRRRRRRRRRCAE